jgi:hypothetical protein
MSMYVNADTIPNHPESGSGTQVPRPLHLRGTNTIFSKAVTPALKTITKNPDHIFINQTGSYFFKYDTTGSIGDSDAGGDSPYEFGINVQKGATGLPIRLDISPCAWSGSIGSIDDAGGNHQAGDVTFVYRGK